MECGRPTVRDPIWGEIYKMSLTALEWGLRAPITPRFGGNLEALPCPQDTEPKQQQKTDLKHKESDRPSDTISDLEITWKFSVACATEHYNPNFESSIPQASRIWRVRRRLVGVHRCAFSLRWVDCEQADQFPHGRDGHALFICDTKSNFKETLV